MKRPHLISQNETEELAAQAGDLTLSRTELRRIARLAFTITAVQQRRAGALVVVHWDELGSERQAAAALGAGRIIQALALLGYIETDDDGNAT